MKFKIKAYNYANPLQEQLELLLNNAKLIFNTNSDNLRENIDEFEHPENQNAESLDYMIANPSNYSIKDMAIATKTQEDYEKVYNYIQKDIKNEERLSNFSKDYKEFKKESPDIFSKHKLELYNNLILNNRLKKHIKIKR